MMLTVAQQHIAACQTGLLTDGLRHAKGESTAQVMNKQHMHDGGFGARGVGSQKCALLKTRACWAEARIKIARMTLTIKLDRNWSSFQLANSAPPLSVTGSAIAPSARMRDMVDGVEMTGGCISVAPCPYAGPRDAMP
jgi:hypothetical protein